MLHIYNSLYCIAENIGKLISWRKKLANSGFERMEFFKEENFGDFKPNHQQHFPLYSKTYNNIIM